MLCVQQEVKQNGAYLHIVLLLLDFALCDDWRITCYLIYTLRL